MGKIYENYLYICMNEACIYGNAESKYHRAGV